MCTAVTIPGMGGHVRRNTQAQPFGQKVRDTRGKRMYKLVHGRGDNYVLYP